MELTNLPTEIIFELAGFLNIVDIKKFGIALNVNFPEYIFVSKCKEIFNRSLNKINQINYVISTSTTQQSSRQSFKNSHLTIYIYSRDNLYRGVLMAFRSGDGYSNSNINSSTCQTNFIYGVKRCVGIALFVETKEPSKCYYVSIINP